MEWLTMSQWSPYAVGAGIGVLSCIAFLFSNKPLGASTAFVRTSGMLEKLFRREKIREKIYYKKFEPKVDWEWMLVIGIIVGSFISSQLSGDFQVLWVPAVWRQAAGDSIFLRWLVSLAGGIILGFGARWAGGCTSGHGISGTLQLAVSSWIAACCFFIGGISVAMLLFRILLTG